MLERLRALVGAQRVPRTTTAVDVAVTLPADPIRAATDLEAWRTYRDENDAFRRMRLRIERHEAIERGRKLDDELPQSAAEKENGIEGTV